MRTLKTGLLRTKKEGKTTVFFFFFFFKFLILFLSLFRTILLASLYGGVVIGFKSISQVFFFFFPFSLFFSSPLPSRRSFLMEKTFMLMDQWLLRTLALVFLWRQNLGLYQGQAHQVCCVSFLAAVVAINLSYIHLLSLFLDSSWRKGGETATISCQNDCIGIYVSLSASSSVISKGFNSSSEIKSGSFSFSSFQPPSVFSFSHFLFFSFPQ